MAAKAEKMVATQAAPDTAADEARTAAAETFHVAEGKASEATVTATVALNVKAEAPALLDMYVHTKHLFLFVAVHSALRTTRLNKPLKNGMQANGVVR